MRRFFHWPLCVALFSFGSVADAQKRRESDSSIRVRWDEGAPFVDLSVGGKLERRVREKLRSGLPQTTVIRVLAYKKGKRNRPIAVGVRSCRVVFDLWEERYHVDSLLEGQAPRLIERETEVIERCLMLRRKRIGDATDFRKFSGRQVYFSAIVELNPVSRSMLRKIRRWLARPSGARQDSDAFFGSFVSLFVNQKVAQAERQARLHSGPTKVP